MKKILSITVAIAACLASLTSCNNSNDQTEEQEHTVLNINDSSRIVVLGGTLTEIVYQLGLGDKVVAVDVTSIYPQVAQQLPKVGHNRNVSSEAILAQNPTLVLSLNRYMRHELKQQLESANIPMITYTLEGEIENTKNIIQRLSDTLGMSDKAAPIISRIDNDLSNKATLDHQPKVLFIYARGAGTMMAGGTKTEAHKMIELAGGQNAASGFEQFKPITSEALVEANPDVILMFSDGLQSVEGIDGLLQVPGIAQTNAGKNKKVIAMDGLYLTGFGPRVGMAITELSKKLSEVAKP